VPQIVGPEGDLIASRRDSDEATRTSNSACVWIAEAMVEGRTYTARSQHGPANELARQLVAARLVDRPLIIRYYGLAGTLTYHSCHSAATWTFSEGERTLRRVRYREPPEGVFLGSGTGQKCVSSPVADDVESLPANGRKTAAPPPAVETRQLRRMRRRFPARPPMVALLLPCLPAPGSSQARRKQISRSFQAMSLNRAKQAAQVQR
jgi:hypothetical protein